MWRLRGDAYCACFFQAGRGDDGFNLLKGSILDGMYLGKSPGNFGQISLYDAVRRETYRDFADQIGITSRTLIQACMAFRRML